MRTSRLRPGHGGSAGCRRRSGAAAAARGCSRRPCTSTRFRMFGCPRRWTRCIPPVSGRSPSPTGQVASSPARGWVARSRSGPSASRRRRHRRSRSPGGFCARRAPASLTRTGCCRGRTGVGALPRGSAPATGLEGPYGRVRCVAGGPWVRNGPEPGPVMRGAAARLSSSGRASRWSSTQPSTKFSATALAARPAPRGQPVSPPLGSQPRNAMGSSPHRRAGMPVRGPCREWVRENADLTGIP